jgi:hypothetical protein
LATVATCPAGSNAPVASASRRSSRAASAPPSSATTSVRCWTKGVPPGTPESNRRSTISMLGRSVSRARASTDNPCSNTPSHPPWSIPRASAGAAVVRAAHLAPRLLRNASRSRVARS